MVFLSSILSFVAILFTNAVLIKSDIPNPRVAVALLRTQNVTGTIYFTDMGNGTIYVTGLIQGLKQGLYGFHIHELGNTLTCDMTGPHFNPHGTVHGGRYHDVRHVGDFGNVKFEGAAGVAIVDFLDTHIKFSGQNNILGRSVVLHEHEDDLGKGNHELSPITGNAGPRIACGVIGIHSGVWNSGISTYYSSSLLIFGIVFLCLN